MMAVKNDVIRYFGVGQRRNWRGHSCTQVSVATCLRRPIFNKVGEIVVMETRPEKCKSLLNVIW